MNMIVDCLIVLLFVSYCVAFKIRHPAAPTVILSRKISLQMTFEGRNGFLLEKDPFYRQVIISNTMTALKQAINDNKRLLEIEFPPSKVNDISVTETLDVTRTMLLEMLTGLSTLYPGEKMYAVWPDRGECALAIKNGYGDRTPWKMSIINDVLAAPIDEEVQVPLTILYCSL